MNTVSFSARKRSNFLLLIGSRKMAMAADGAVTVKMVQERTAFNKSTVAMALSSMVQDSLLTRTQRGVYWLSDQAAAFPATGGSHPQGSKTLN